MTRVRLATGNPGKVALLGRYLTAAGFEVDAADPGDAEDRAPVGYESAVLAKLRGALRLAPQGDTPLIAHDSGFEFECLGGEPGARTRAWLAGLDGRVGDVLVPGTAVRVVHWIALWQPGGIRVRHEHDERIVPDGLTVTDSALPLTESFAGPREALGRLMAGVVAAIREETG